MLKWILYNRSPTSLSTPYINLSWESEQCVLRDHIARNAHNKEHPYINGKGVPHLKTWHYGSKSEKERIYLSHLRERAALLMFYSDKTDKDSRSMQRPRININA